jgi:hypothetical protein
MAGSVDVAAPSDASPSLPVGTGELAVDRKPWMKSLAEAPDCMPMELAGINRTDEFASLAGLIEIMLPNGVTLHASRSQGCTNGPASAWRHRR